METLPKTLHAETRSQQRCIPDFVIECLDKFGTSTHAGNGTEKVYFDKKAKRRIKTYLGKGMFKSFRPYLNAYIVIGCQGKVVTEGYRDERVKRN